MLIPSRVRVLCRGEQLLLTFFGVGSSQLKLVWASLSVLGAEWNVDRFSDRRLSVEVSVKILRSQIAAPFRDQGLFRAIFLGEISGKV